MMAGVMLHSMLLHRLGEEIGAPIRDTTDNATGGKDQRAGCTRDSISIHVDQTRSVTCTRGGIGTLLLPRCCPAGPTMN